jgi:hypothetical protein
MAITTVDELCARAKSQGWDVVRGSKHIELVPPNRGPIVIVAGTPSCPRALLNTIGRMKPSGFDPDLTAKEAKKLKKLAQKEAEK